MSNQLVYDVTDADFEARVVQRSYQVPVVIDFWADWCAPCHALGPILERGVEARGGAVELARIDVDQSPQLAAAFGVQGIPAVKAVKEGRLVDEFVGAQPQNVVEQFLDGLLPSQADVAAAEPLARARLALASADPGADFGKAAGRALDGEAEEALSELLAAVREGPGERRDRARELMLDVFRVLGDDHPLARRYRKDLTSALF